MSLRLSTSALEDKDLKKAGYLFLGSGTIQEGNDTKEVHVWADKEGLMNLPMDNIHWIINGSKNS